MTGIFLSYSLVHRFCTAWKCGLREKRVHELKVMKVPGMSNAFGVLSIEGPKGHFRMCKREKRAKAPKRELLLTDEISIMPRS